MKKIFCAVLLFLAVFAFSACAEEIEFPSAGITIDVPAGWEYSDNGQGAAILTAPDKSAAISVSKVDAQGHSLEVWASELSKQHGGTTPTPAGDAAMSYTFGGGKSTVIVTVADGKVGILSITGEHPDVGGIVDSIDDI